MWQRIQTIFMAAAIGCLLGFLLVPSGTLSEQETPVSVGRQALAIAAILMSALAIGLYKNRPLQIKLNLVAAALIAGVYIWWLLDPVRQNPSYRVHWGMFMPGFAVVFWMLAIRRIRHDENLVRSMDRLR